MHWADQLPLTESYISLDHHGTIGYSNDRENRALGRHECPDVRALSHGEKGRVVPSRMGGGYPPLIFVFKSWWLAGNDPQEVEARAEAEGVKNIVAIPQITRIGDEFPAKSVARAALGIDENSKVHFMQLGISGFMQATEAISSFITVASQRPNDTFWLAVNDHTRSLVATLKDSGALPVNVVLLEWLGREEMTNRIAAADTFWIRAGNRNSIMEAIQACVGSGVVPILLTPDKLTDKAVSSFEDRDFMGKLLPIMMALETEAERETIFHSVTSSLADTDANTDCSAIILNPLKQLDSSDINQLLDRIDDVRPKIQGKLKKIRIGTTLEVSELYKLLLNSNLSGEDLVLALREIRDKIWK